MGTKRKIAVLVRKGTDIDFASLDSKKDYWELNIIGSKVLPFFQQVWPYLTMGDMGKMRATYMNQVMWSAKGFGLTVSINGKKF